MIITAFILLLLGIMIGLPIPFVFMGSTIFFIFGFGYEADFLLPYGYSRMNNPVILAIPLFIIAGGLINRSHIADRLVSFVDSFIGNVKGSLSIVTVFSCALFGSITGSGAATIAGVGSVMFEKLEERGYPKGFSAALIASSSVLGMLIPPSAIMILYAWIANQSVLAAFLATVVPGLMLACLLSVFSYFYLRNKLPDTEISLKNQSALAINYKVNKFSLFKIFGSESSLPALLMPIVILGSIYGGILTPTEAAALGVIYAIPVGLWIYKRLKVKDIFEVLLDAATTTGSIMIMLFAVMLLSRMYLMEDVPGIIIEYLTQISENKLVLLLIINLFMVLIGMLMDDVSAVLLCTPILFPISQKLGIDPVHFAAILGVNLGMGNITPPTAPLLFLSGQIGRAEFSSMLKPTLLMMIFAWIPTLLLTTYYPALSTWLPSLVL